MSDKAIRESFDLGRTPFRTFDPFLFCMHHRDQYPAGEENMGPNPHLLNNRDIGSDFSNQDGWSMYHGQTVPGFPEHPHRGFETITIVQEGVVDHSDSIKCTARYGNGDTQWLTAGKGIQHSEMFPLLHRDKPNPLDLFQVWLNLPKCEKFCDPCFTMLWDEVTQRATLPDPKGGAATVVRVVAGELSGVTPLAPPPNSWAHDAAHDVAVWVLRIPAGSTATLPAARGGAASTRAIYFTRGKQLHVADEQTVEVRTGARVRSDFPLSLQALSEEAEVLVLQGQPIGEPVVHHGPFVMNTQPEIMECFDDFRRTLFGGWPWSSSDHSHARDTPRHAVHLDGRREGPPNKN